MKKNPPNLFNTETQCHDDSLTFSQPIFLPPSKYCLAFLISKPASNVNGLFLEKLPQKDNVKHIVLPFFLRESLFLPHFSLIKCTAAAGTASCSDSLSALVVSAAFEAARPRVRRMQNTAVFVYRPAAGPVWRRRPEAASAAAMATAAFHPPSPCPNFSSPPRSHPLSTPRGREGGRAAPLVLSPRRARSRPRAGGPRHRATTNRMRPPTIQTARPSQ